MKRIVLLALLIGGVALAAMAQTGLDLSQPTPQLFSFNLGVPLGFSLDDDNFEGVVGGLNFGVNIAVIDKLSVGFDHITYGGAPAGTVTSPAVSFNALRVGYSLTPLLGIALGIGGQTGSGTGTVPDGAAASIGVYADLLQNRSTVGVAYGLKLRVDYVTPTDDFSKGAILFTTGISFGL
ncbi:hypothetical protein FACS1894163_13600 [Spirochaetia bacterium]|nr:hypothetical protein FACS1894163_13600 [Spirochaetia bacterium]